ncbi:predicted protein, partial [Nematostella vectensis]
VTEAGDWPDNVQLYQPSKGEIKISGTFLDSSLIAFLKFCQLPYDLKCVKNAESMSPTGEVPLLRAGKDLVGGPQDIFSLVNHKGLSVSQDFEARDKAEMKAYISLINRSILPTELYMLWCKPGWQIRTTHQYGSQFPVPLNYILSYRKQWAAHRSLHALNWQRKKEAGVVEEFEKACQALAEKLGTNQYFIQGRPTEVDALAFGHINSILSRYQPDDTLVAIVHKHRNLEDFVMRILNDFFLNK